MLINTNKAKPQTIIAVVNKLVFLKSVLIKEFKILEECHSWPFASLAYASVAKGNLHAASILHGNLVLGTDIFEPITWAVNNAMRVISTWINLLWQIWWTDGIISCDVKDNRKYMSTSFIKAFLDLIFTVLGALFFYALTAGRIQMIHIK